MNKHLKTAKRRRKYYTMQKKKDARTKLYGRIRFLKTFNKVDEWGNVILHSKYFTPYLKIINCQSCKHNIPTQRIQECKQYNPIFIVLEDLENDCRRFFCQGHEFGNRLIPRKYKPFGTPLTNPTKRDIIKP